ncbi:hypothetical protein [Alicyclobacillus fodiniaquatilis]|uniref:Uncharacterized protein n=1 Tax=Alicyclobacillus fodiniaquatilis TaxID=1661150 RepID=A0ABW4JH86_9BACL
MQPVSIFMMDVTDSTHFESPRELDRYLKQIVSWISRWTEGEIQARVKNRYGDEILFVSEHFFTSYVVAYFIKQIWRYDNHPPIFANTYGMIEESLHTIEDIDTWNHPLFKNARNAMDKLKKDKRERPWFMTEAEDYLEDSLFARMHDTILYYQDRIFKNHSPQQRIASALYTVCDTQQEVATILHRTPANISKLLSKADSDALNRTFEIVRDIYLRLECHANQSDLNVCLPTVHSLLHAIKSHLRTHLDSIFELNGVDRHA